MRSLVKLKISKSAHAEIAQAVRDAGAADLIMRDGAVNMDGIAVVPDPDRLMPPGIVEIDAGDITREAFRDLYSIDQIKALENED